MVFTEYSAHTREGGEPSARGSYFVYMYCICILCFDTGIYHGPLCTMWDCDQQIPWYLAVLAWVQVQLLGGVMGQP